MKTLIHSGTTGSVNIPSLGINVYPGDAFDVADDTFADELVAENPETFSVAVSPVADVLTPDFSTSTVAPFVDPLAVPVDVAPVVTDAPVDSVVPTA